MNLIYRHLSFSGTRKRTGRFCKLGFVRGVGDVQRESEYRE